MEEIKQVPILTDKEPKNTEYINHFYILPVESEIVINFNTIDYHETLKHVENNQSTEIHVNPVASIQMRREVAMDLFRELAARLMPIQQPREPETDKK